MYAIYQFLHTPSQMPPKVFFNLEDNSIQSLETRHMMNANEKNRRINNPNTNM